MSKNIKTKMDRGLPSVGTWMQIASSSVAEILGRAGYDWVAADLEHGQFDSQTLPEIFRAIELGGSIPFARIAQAEMNHIKHALDAGAKGLIFPMIETRKQLENAISYSFYPPKGLRGVGYCRANLFGKAFNEYMKKDATDIFIVAQIEHIEAVRNLDEILSVKELDAIMIGPYDLSGSMGITGQFDHPEFKRVLEEVFIKTNDTEVSMGMHIVQPDEEMLKFKIQEGYQFIAYGIDAVFLYKFSANPVRDK